MLDFTAFVESSADNRLPSHNNTRIYDAPLIGFASAKDPLFSDFKDSQVIGPQFIIPIDWLPEAETVISYFLPFSKAIRNSNRFRGLPSEIWIDAKTFGERFNNIARKYLVEYLTLLDGTALAPSLDERFISYETASNWSERHIAYVAGLGTFGLHRALITERGCAGRIGSVITTLKYKSTERNYKTYYDYCPYLTEGKCGVCMKRCPVSAIKKKERQKQICRRYLTNDVAANFAASQACGKCSVSVPCEYSRPLSLKKEENESIKKSI
ncbi:MAG TPA: 4Fe-4S ferredoxin [Clostridiales bacterium]|jgi:epoxyqueuosine reductase QueG|nr:4Fe-4S ferredoxin [Clostridiales bacterium]